MTPEEERWQASAYAPDKLTRKLKQQRRLLAIWCVLILFWLLLLLFNISVFGWPCLVIMLLGFIHTAIGIRNSKRLLAGKKPWGEI